MYHTAVFILARISRAIFVTKTKTRTIALRSVSTKTRTIAI